MNSSALTLTGCNQRLTLQVKAKTVSAMGTTSEWTDQGTHWGQITPLDARARLIGSARQGEATHAAIFRREVVLEYGVHRIRWGARLFEPLAPRERYQGATVIECKEVAA
jgi:head-tail adaptor